MQRNYTKTYHIIFDAFGVARSFLSSERFVLEMLFDIFSCRPFDYVKTRRYLYRKLKVTPKNVETLEVKYPWE